MTTRAHAGGRRHAALTLLLTVSLTLAGCAGGAHTTRVPDTPPAADSSATVGEVTAFLTHYIATLEARDPVAVRALFVDDGRFDWFTDGARSYASADDVLAGMQRYAALEFRTELSDVQVTPLGDRHAAASTRFVTELSGPGMQSFTYSGVITLLVERELPGGWRIVSGHTSTPGGPPTDDAAPNYEPAVR